MFKNILFLCFTFSLFTTSIFGASAAAASITDPNELRKNAVKMINTSIMPYETMPFMEYPENIRRLAKRGSIYLALPTDKDQLQRPTNKILSFSVCGCPFDPETGEFYTKKLTLKYGDKVTVPEYFYSDLTKWRTIELSEDGTTLKWVNYPKN